MAGIATTTTTAAFAPLEWESNHFGIRAAQLATADLSDEALASCLQAARAQQVELVVWSAPGGREAPWQLLAEFGGTLVDQKVTYARSLDPTVDSARSKPGGVSVVEYAEPTSSPALVELALASGEYSRFRVDPRISRERFEAMYRIWIDRSVAGELADAVLVARPADQNERDDQSPAGMITLSARDGVASIGLVAVAHWARKRGVGSALLDEAHRWMQNRGAREACVVTQQTNLPACRLYERAGYRPAELRHIFHFWLS